MKTDVEGEEFQAMLKGEKGVSTLDVARDLKDIIEDNIQLTAELEKWQKEAESRGDKVSSLIDEKNLLEESHKALKSALSELSK